MFSEFTIFFTIEQLLQGSTLVVVPQKDIHHILCVKPRGIGDIILSTIVLENLAAHFPGALIDYLVEDFAKEAVVHNPLVARVITMTEKEFPLRTARRVRKEQYDLMLDFWSNPRSAQVTFLSGVKFRAGYGYRGRKYAYNILATSERGSHHAAEHNLEILKAVGVPVISKNIYYPPPRRACGEARTWVAGAYGTRRPLVGIVPSGGWASKRCEISTWVEICRQLKGRFSCNLVVLWGPGDEQDAAGILAGVGESIVQAPPTSIEELGGFLSQCALVIANDSGPMHMAAAMGVPTIGIFGPTDPAAHGPYGPRGGAVNHSDLHCIVCNKLTCPYNHECMRDLPIDRLMLLVEKLAGSVLKG